MKRIKYEKHWEFLLLLALLGLLSGCGKDEAEIPVEYQIGEDTVLALDSEEEISVEESVGENEVTYKYLGFTDPKEACAAYVAELTDEENLFTVVDEDLAQAEMPDLTTDEGQIILARTAAEDGKLCVVRLDWTEETCTITLELDEKTEEQTEAEDQLNLTNVIDYMKTLTPAELGLEGDSMDEYQIYSLNGVVFADGYPCLHLRVCRADNPQQTNEIAGDFLVTGDKSHLFSLDAASGEIVELF
jgi:hypothetical protein